IQNFDNMNKLSGGSEDFSIIVHEVQDILDKGLSEESLKHEISNYFNNHNINLQQIYNWLLNNQNDNLFNILLLGIFNHLGIEMDINTQKAFELYQKASDLGNALGINNLGYCYLYGIGTDINKQKAFK